MPVVATRPTIETMIVRGINPRAPIAAALQAGERYAAWLQESIANLFDNEQVVGGKLEANDPDYTKWKKSKGLDTSRGHATGKLQRALDNKKLFTVTMDRANNKVKIVMKIDKLRDEVSYAGYFQDAKAPNDTILGLKRGWTRQANRFFKEVS